MARYTGPKTKVARRFKEPIFGPDKGLQKKQYGPGQHGPSKRSPKKSEYSVQLGEKQKMKYINCITVHYEIHIPFFSINNNTCTAVI